MSIWQTKLQKFIKGQIDKEVKTCKKSGLTKKREKDIRKHLQSLAEVKDANNTEPILKYYLNKQVTPREHLQDLLNQLKNDVYPLLKVPGVTPGGAPFTILRNVFCFLDYIALLRFGPSNNYGKGMGKIGKLLDDFGPDDMKVRYRKYKAYLIQIYRHDLVHLTSPRLKIMKVKRKNRREKIEVVTFAIISDTINDGGKKKKDQILQDFSQACSLMRSVQFRKNTFFHLRLLENIPTINSISVLFDLANYIKDYQASLAKEEELNRTFAENFIATNLNSALKLLDAETIDLSENKQIITTR